MKFVLYTSVLNQDDYDVLVVPDIFKTARANNSTLGITGILLFDGLNFTQYIEGDPESLDRLFNKIIQDKRHKNLVVVSSGEQENRLYMNWGMGYVDTSNKAIDIIGHTSDPNFSLIGFKEMISSLYIV